jgi:AGZA family xanthine/uracil permease-like MFS transporter
MRTSTRTEILAGISTFLTMVYIVFVNPKILHEAGMDSGAVFTATCLVSAFACIVTGFYAKTPIGVAPGMALNIYFTYSVVQSLAIAWPQALAMVVVSGALFFLISLTPLRRLLLESIPHNLQIAILIGISLLIALIALQENGLIVAGSHTLMHLGDLRRPECLLFLLGFLFLLGLDHYRVRGAIIIGILAISVMSLILGVTSWQGAISSPPSMQATFLRLDFSHMMTASALKGTFTLLLITVFDATGTLIGLLNQPEFNHHRHYAKQLSRSLTVDAAASTLAGLLGSASTSPYIESAVGIEAGGRRGLTAIVVGIGFLLMLFFFPLAETIPSFAVGPALLYVACCMMKHLGRLSLENITETAPCMLTIILIPFTYSIADGIGGGIILYALLKLISREKVSPLLLVLSFIFVVFFVLQ